MEADPITGVINYTAAIDEFDNGRKMPPSGKYAPKHFFRAALIGPGGCGKTNALCSMVMNDDPDLHVFYEKIYIFAKDIHEKAYDYLKSKLDKVEEIIKQTVQKPPEWKLYVMSDNLADVPLVKDLDDNVCNLMIFDDWARDSEKEQNIIEQHYKMGRKKNCSYFYLSQSYFDTPPFIRKQLTHLFVWRLRNETDINNFIREHNPGFDDKVCKKMYMIATEPKYSFALFDKLNPDCPIRQGFRGMPNWASNAK